MKPYVRKLKTFQGFQIWLVDEDWIRDKKTVYFVDVGQHLHFKFIPGNEIWIAKRLKQEARYLIKRALLENKFMNSGISYEKAHKRAIELEEDERKEIHGNIYRKLLIDNKIKVWLVNGKIVRSRHDADFSGSHDIVDKHVPGNEIWIDDSMSRFERKMMMLHELHERNLMFKGMSYKQAHKRASDLETKIRRNKNKLNSAIKNELNNIEN